MFAGCLTSRVPEAQIQTQREEGVVTKLFGGTAEQNCGLRAGDVIFKINNSVVANKKDFEALMAEGLKRNYILYQVKRRDEIFFLPVKLDTLL